MNELPKPSPETHSQQQGEQKPIELFNGGFRRDPRKARKPRPYHPWSSAGRFPLGGYDQIEAHIGDTLITDDTSPAVGIPLPELPINESTEPKTYTISSILERAKLEVTFPKKVLLSRLLREAGVDLSDRSAISLTQSELNDILNKLK